MFTDCTVDYHGSKLILDFQLESIVEIILLKETKRKLHNDLFRDFKYSIKKNLDYLPHTVSSTANEERNTLSLAERGKLDSGIVKNIFIDDYRITES